MIKAGIENPPADRVCALCKHCRKDPNPGPYIWCELQEMTFTAGESCDAFEVPGPGRSGPTENPKGSTAVEELRAAADSFSFSLGETETIRIVLAELEKATTNAARFEALESNDGWFCEAGDCHRWADTPGGEYQNFEGSLANMADQIIREATK